MRAWVCDTIRRPLPSYQKWTCPQICLGYVSEHFQQFSFYSENFWTLENFRSYVKWTRPITPEILIYQKISLLPKLFRLKRSTKKVSCEFSEKSVFRVISGVGLEKFRSLQKWARPITPHSSRRSRVGAPAGAKLPGRSYVFLWG